MRNFTTVVLLLFVHMVVYCQNHNIRIQLDGVCYEKMEAEFSSFLVAGVELEDRSWLFVVPDSIFSTYTSTSFVGYKTNQDSVAYHINFNIVLDEYPFETSSNVFFFSDIPDTYIKACFQKRTDVLSEKYCKDEFFIYEGDSEVFNSLKMVEEFVHALRTLPGEESAKVYLNILRKYPTTRSALTLSSIGVNLNLSMLEDVYSIISPELKDSYYGKRILREISKKKSLQVFNNMSLPDWQTGIEENIVKDSSNYTLVVFSASWCSPCHKLIPVLKQIYNDLHQYLDIVYVSVDDDKTEKHWKDLMIKKDIPWRSLLAAKQYAGVIERYFAESIPRLYFVDKERKGRMLDFARGEDLEWLYSSVLSVNNNAPQ
ncbi:TlpA family protein disulfide reductase [Dysgonomonas sp. GY617]|uniref:TlpA family protein disulfide reductase n=1 Tax=Dysgonomonas sp. GY617 TaxID=2780420 RepID=UPI0018843E72|nr:TlpA disulfide reductase family protein [Dysgonomonas sp. GY617]MBF0577065.1 TlpA family protein disulfide reductase [Dysgonomonas sp. GY617]